MMIAVPFKTPYCVSIESILLNLLALRKNTLLRFTTFLWLCSVVMALNVPKLAVNIYITYSDQDNRVVMTL